MHGCNTHTIDQLLLRSKCLRRCRGPGVRQMCERGARRMNEKFRAQNCQCDPLLGVCSLLHRQDRQLCDSVGAYILVRVRGLLHVSRLDSLVDLHRCFSPVELCAVCVGVCGCVCVCVRSNSREFVRCLQWGWVKAGPLMLFHIRGARRPSVAQCELLTREVIAARRMKGSQLRPRATQGNRGGDGGDAPVALGSDEVNCPSCQI